MGVLKARVGTTWEPVTGATWQLPGNAIGIVAMGSLPAQTTLPASTVTQVTNNLPYTMLVGRRYKVHVAVRAVGPQSNTAVGIQFWLRDGTTTLPDASGAWIQLQNNQGFYHFFAYDWVFDGDGVARSWNVAANPSAVASVVYVQNQGYFYIEDVGPNSYPPQSLPVTYQAWTPLPFGSWTDIGGFVACSYRKVGDVVSLRGVASATSTSNVIGTLPVGFRPSLTHMFATASQDAFGRVDLNASGQILYQTNPVNAGRWVNLGNISFSTTA